MADQNITNLILVGRTGNGKSSTGNTLLGQRLFVSKIAAGGITMKCEMYRATTQDGRLINVIDTPGFFDLSVSDEYLSKEINNGFSLAKEGIHAVLFVLSAKNRISQEEESTFYKLPHIFESKILDYIIVVFTGGDELEHDDQTLDDYLHDGCPEFLKSVLRLCNGRKVLFDNRTNHKDKKAEQLKQLWAHVADVGKRNGGIPYTYQRQLHRKDDGLHFHQSLVAGVEEEIDKLLIKVDEQRKTIADMQEEIKSNTEEIAKLKELVAGVRGVFGV